MAAFDFPPTPAIGTLYPLVAEVGKPQYRWNGNEWVAATLDPAGYVRKSGDAMTGALSLAGDPTQALHAVPKQYLDAQRQRISLVGVKQIDVQVPAGAVMARICGMTSPVSASAGLLVLQLSVAAGVFRSAPGDYQLSGFHAAAVTATIQHTSTQANLTGMLLTASHDQPLFPQIWDGLVQLKRKSATAHLIADFRGEAWNTTGGHIHSFYENLLLSTAAGSALDVLALRLTTTSAANWDTDSYLNVEWL